MSLSIILSSCIPVLADGEISFFFFFYGRIIIFHGVYMPQKSLLIYTFKKVIHLKFSTLIIAFNVFFKHLFIFERERESVRESTSGGGAERGTREAGSEL